MAIYHVLYNPYSNNSQGEKGALTVKALMPQDQLEFVDMTKLESYEAYFAALPEKDPVMLCGGDGTLNRFINEGLSFAQGRDIYYYACGSGNDFWKDLGKERGERPVCINRYLVDLPQVVVNGKKSFFLNGIGYGIDGYCCEVGDKLRETSDKPINYTAIAIKGLLFHYHPTNAVVTVDGVKHEYRKVWLAPTMNGRYYGGGMMPTPAQDRLSQKRTVSTMVMNGAGKLRTLIAFPKIFSGEHVKITKLVHIFSGNGVTVEFDRPTAIQIDGETILGVTKYQILTHVREKQSETV